MCGIVGSVQVGGVQPCRHEVVRAMTAMAHRGPDGEGFKEFVLSKHAAEPSTLTTTVCIGHRRLAIIDLSEAAAQPMSTPDERFHIILNGEIYNYREIRTELEALGHVFRTRSDTEVLLAGWQRWGPDLLPRLIGMFSFAVLDLEKSVLVLARDPFGIKPLYYARSSQGLIFASEIAPLLDFPGVSRKANAETSYEFLAGGMGDHSDKTFYRDIVQLPAAHYLAIECHSPATCRACTLLGTQGGRRFAPVARGSERPVPRAVRRKHSVPFTERRPSRRVPFGGNGFIVDHCTGAGHTGTPSAVADFQLCRG